jgi:hypothetical protein
MGEIFAMAEFHRDRRSRRRARRQFRPGIDAAPGLALETRTMLSHGGITLAELRHVTAKSERAAAAAQKHAAKAGSGHLTPLQEVQSQYNQFLNNYNVQIANYVGSLEETSSGTIPVNTTVTASTAAGSALIPVADAAVFGPAGTYSNPVIATAFIGTVAVGSFSLIGSSGTNVLVNTADSTNIALPQGTVLTATVPTSASTSAASIFPNYITASTTQLARNLVIYFNAQPYAGPTKNIPPHTPTAYGAVQQYVYQVIAGSNYGPGLQSVLAAIPLPTTAGQDLDIYNATVQSAVAQSESQVINGIREITNKKLLINAAAPNNRLGINASSSTSSGTGSSSSTSSSSTTG